MQWNVPNVLSLLRIVFTLVAAVVFLSGSRLTGLLIGGAAGLTDVLDGWLARKLGQTSEIGAILDRLGDLTFESAALIVLTALGALHPAYAIAYHVREFAVLSIRQYAARRGAEIPSNWLGKIKTHCIGFGACFLLSTQLGLLSPEASRWSAIIGEIAIGSGLLFSYVSGIRYVAAGLHEDVRK